MGKKAAGLGDSAGIDDAFSRRGRRSTTAVALAAPTVSADEASAEATGDATGTEGSDSQPAGEVDGTTERRAGIVSALRGGGIVNTVPLGSIAAHPDNPRENLGDLAELKASIESVGVLQPLVVVAAGRFLARHPQHRDTIGEADYVVLAGHRRHAAAELAGKGEVPVVVRDDLAGPQEAAETFLHENLSRRDLAPLEEARGYQLLVDMKVSQREIARRRGVSQGHISKRLSLLGLPERVQDAMRTDQFSIANALRLVEVPSGDQEAVYDLAVKEAIPIEHAARQLARQRQAEKAKARAVEQAVSEGVPLIEPSETFGTEPHRHRLYDETEIEAARAAGTLVAAAVDSGLAYYTIDQVTPTSSAASPAGASVGVPARSPVRPEPPSVDERERRKAMKARAAAAGELVATVPGAARLRDDLAAGVLRRLDYSAALKLVHGWLGTRYGDRVADPYQWRDSLREPAHITHVAWAMTIADQEVKARWTHSTWSADDVAWLERLQRETGYAPTPWEEQRLAAASGDSAGITDSPAPSSVPSTAERPARGGRTDDAAPDIQEAPE